MSCFNSSSRSPDGFLCGRLSVFRPPLPLAQCPNRCRSTRPPYPARPFRLPPLPARLIYLHYNLLLPVRLPAGLTPAVPALPPFLHLLCAATLILLPCTLLHFRYACLYFRSTCANLRHLVIFPACSLYFRSTCTNFHLVLLPACSFHFRSTCANLKHLVILQAYFLPLFWSNRSSGTSILLHSLLPFPLLC